VYNNFIREALYRLASVGLIKIILHRGFLIRKWSFKEIEDVRGNNRKTRTGND